MFRNALSTVLAGACLLALGAAAQAQVVISDGFAYAPGDITNASGGAGWPNDSNHNWFTEGG